VARGSAGSGNAGKRVFEAGWVVIGEAQPASNEYTLTF
jgi:hypothetical protein